MRKLPILLVIFGLLLLVSVSAFDTFPYPCHTIGGAKPSLLDNIVGCWQLNETTINNNFSSDINDYQLIPSALFTNAHIGVGKYGNGIHLVGNNYLESATDSADYKLQNFTVAMWYNTTAEDGYGNIYDSYYDASANRGVRILIKTNITYVYINDNINLWCAKSNNFNNSLRHLTLVYSNNYQALYDNGTFCNSTSVNTVIGYGTGKIKIGGINPSVGFYKGMIDNFILLKKTATPLEVQHLFSGNYSTSANFTSVQDNSSINNLIGNSINMSTKYTNANGITSCSLYTNQTGTHKAWNTTAYGGITIANISYTYKNSTSPDTINYYFMCDPVVGLNETSENKTIKFQSFLIDNCSSFTNHVINFSIYNETSNTLVAGVLRAYFETRPNGTQTYKSFNITWAANTTPKLCMRSSMNNITANAQMEYYATGFSTKTYYLYQSTLTNQSRLINLYLSDGVSDVLFNVLDENNDPVINAYISIATYDISTNSYVINQIIRTNDDGQGIGKISIGKISIGSEYYKFFIHKEGVLIFTSSESLILSSPKTFKVSLFGGILSDYNKLNEVSGNVIYVNTTKQFRYTYSDPNNNIERAELLIYKKQNNNVVFLNSSSSTSPSGVIIAYVNEPLVEGATYYAKGMVTIEGNDYQQGYKEFVNDIKSKIFGLQGVFVSIFLAIGLVVVGLWHPIPAIVFLTLSVVLTSLLGLFVIGWGATVGLITLAVVTVVKIRK